MWVTTATAAVVVYRSSAVVGVFSRCDYSGGAMEYRGIPLMSARRVENQTYADSHLTQ